MKRQTAMSSTIFLVLMMLLGVTTLAVPVIPKAPKENIYVQDYAGMFSETTKTKLLEEAAQLDKDTTAQFCVVTIKSLDGSSVEEYANGLFRKWGIGTKKENNGLLLLLSEEDRKIRIETGYGLEGQITDAKAGRMVRELTDYFKDSKYDEGVQYVFDTVAGEIYAMYGSTDKQQEFQKRAKAAQDQKNGYTPENMRTLFWIVTTIVGIFVLCIIIAIAGRGRWKSGSRYGKRISNKSWYSSRSSFFDSSNDNSSSSDSSSFGGGDSGGGGASGDW